MQEAQKVIDTLDEKNENISSAALDVVEQIQEFRSKAGDRDKLVLVFATVDPISGKESRAVEDIKAMGKSRFGALFSVENVSIRTIFDLTLDAPFTKNKIPVTARLVHSGSELLVGSIRLHDLYEFMKSYKKATGDLDLLYEKNVRRFLGGNRKVNKGIAETLKNSPERFGLFNNGITIVVEDFYGVDDQYELTEPYVVNGCQTTRTIWEFLEKKLASGGTGEEPTEFLEWQEKYKQGIVVVKVVKVGNPGGELLNDTTRFTNSQNAVTGKDFIALVDNFKDWARQIGNKYDVFLEIQRGAWDSRKALQNKRPNEKQYKKSVSAFELIKVYASAWLNQPGRAFGSNPPFVPGGAIFKQITEDENHKFGVDDLYAAYCLYSTAEKRENPAKPAKSPKRSRFLFYYVVVELLRRILRSSTGLEPSLRQISDSIIKLFDIRRERSEAADLLLEQATLLDDDYFNQNGEYSIIKEPTFKGDLNTHLKTYNVSADHAPKLNELLQFNFNDIRKRRGTEKSSSLDIIVQELG